MRFGNLMRLFAVTCRKCHGAKQIETRQRKVAVQTLLVNGWIQTRTGWVCHECQLERARADESRDSNGSAESGIATGGGAAEAPSATRG